MGDLQTAMVLKEFTIQLPSKMEKPPFPTICAQFDCQFLAHSINP